MADLRLQPKWFNLKGRYNSKKKKGEVSGEIQLQFSLADTSDQTASPQDLLQKLSVYSAVGPEDSDDEDDAKLSQMDSLDLEDDDDDDDDDADDKERSTSEENDEPSGKPDKAEKRKRRLRMRKLRRKTKARAYEFSGGSDCVGIIFLEIGKITDLPPERNSRLGRNPRPDTI